MKTVLCHSDDPDSRDAAAQIIEQSKAQLGSQSPKAGLLFCSVEYDHQVCLDAFDEAWPGLPLVGGSSDGEISSSLGFRHDSLLLVLFHGDDLEVRAQLGRDLSSDTSSALEHALGGMGGFEPTLCIATFAPTADSSAIVERISKTYPNCPVVGGLSGDHAEFKRSKEFFGNEVLTDSLPLLFLSGSFSASYGIGSGWFPIGAAFKVTRSEGHIVHEIDGKPALDVYKEHYGSAPAETLGAFPLAVYCSEDSQDEEYVLRAILNSDADTGVLRFAGKVPEGSMVRLTEVLKEGILSGSASSLGNAISSYPGENPSVALVFSCAARKWVLGTEAEKEIHELRDQASQEGQPELSIAGLYCFGEIAPPLPSRPSQFHNEACVSIILGD